MMAAGGWTVRAGGAGDVDAVLALERGVRGAPHWRREEYAGIVGGGGGVRRRLVVAEAGAGMVGPGLVGFAVGSVSGLRCEGGGSGGEITGEIENVAVAAGARRLGIGRALCDGVLGWCRGEGAGAVQLEVRSRSSAAIKLYRSLGFAEEGRRSRYYSEPDDDALLMRLPLPEGTR